MIEERQKSGTVVFPGGYIDRGPDSKGVIDLLRAGPQRAEWRWIALKGNREDMMAGAYAGRSKRSWWIDNGGLETEFSYDGSVPAEDVAWVENLPLMHVDAYRIFVHAGVVPEFPIDMHSPRGLLWLRTHHSADYWGKHLCHGHTASKTKPLTHR